MTMHARRGSALILVLLMTLAVAGLAIAAIFMSSSAGLLSRFYDREREFRLAAEAALEIARTRLSRDTTLAVPDTGMLQLHAGLVVRDAAGAAIPRVRVNTYVAATGDTSGAFVPFVSVIAAAYDANGTRHVRRLDLRRESFGRYGLFVDSFPAGTSHGPGIVDGRVHTNGTWRSSATGGTYRDTVSAVGTVEGVGTYLVDSLVGAVPVRYPRDSSFAWMHTRAAAANLAFTPVSGGGRASRLEFVAVDADGDGTIEQDEGFARVFDLANSVGVDTNRLRIDPPVTTPFFGGSANRYHRWDDPIVQNQCGAFYRFGGRWHFFPVAAHRADYVRDALTAGGAGRYPVVNGGMMNRIDDYSYDAADEILRQAGARCFPAGSPYLMPTERLTNNVGVVTGTIADTRPWGAVAPPGGWPASAPNGYGGSDTTFTWHVRTCTFPQVSDPSPWTCSGAVDLGSWRLFGGTAITGVPASVRQAGELPYLWPLHRNRNAASSGVVSAEGSVYLSGVVRGRVTLRAAGSVRLVDRLRYDSDPNGSPAACTDQLGVLAIGDILVVEGMATRVRRVGEPGFLGLSLASSTTAAWGGETRFGMDGLFMSLTGTVGVENPSLSMGAAGAQLPCPDDGSLGTHSNGGCLAITGGAAMRTFTPLYTAAAHSGYRYFGVPDRCQSTTRRPPFFPLTSRYTPVRTLEIEPSQANTPAKVRAMLMRLKGAAL